MEIIAYIPALPCAPSPSAAPAAEFASPAAAVTAAPLREPVAVAPTVTDEAGPQAAAIGGESTPTRRHAANRRAVKGVFSPSVVALAVVAAAVWAAAWRNDRLRAIEQQRPQRVAMEPPPSAGPERSLTP